MENKELNSPKMRGGWTLIEFLFIIIVIAILSFFALPRLAATRDDAKLSTDVSNMAICIRDAKQHYLATQQVYSLEQNSPACSEIECYTLQFGVNNYTLKVSLNEDTSESYCNDIEYVGGHLVGHYNLKGTSIKR
ncbi:MAG TPA: type II secretion system protein [Helicobacteraceae bacterium]|nr:type II secretion system protein [Helicobacteraceae bacterium]